MNEHYWAAIMAGGVGSRFWPLSRKARPKQLLDLFGQGNMLRLTLERLLPLIPPERILVVTGEKIVSGVIDSLPELPMANILVEPCGRNTAPAIGWAALEIQRRDPQGVLAVLPADQYIVDEDSYRATMQQALSAASAGPRIVTLGIQPTHPETGYGYVKAGAVLHDNVLAVDAFKEKPDLQTAVQYLHEGSYFWNAGMFFMPGQLILDELAIHEPNLLDSLKGLYGSEGLAGPAVIRDVYESLKSISIDYAVMEQAKDIAVIPGNFGWSDVGSWRALWDFAGAEHSFRRGEVIEIDGSGNVIFAEGGMVATVGVNDLIVVHTPDATMVCPREQSQRIREVVKALEGRNQEKLL
jgi:mannose-1-phosphate guanylyltransferase